MKHGKNLLFVALVLVFSFTLFSQRVEASTYATVTVQAATGISSSGATLNGTVTADGGASSTVQGFFYGTSTAYGSVASTTASFGQGSFSQNISGLSASTLYHYEAFVINASGTATSSDTTFTTSVTSGCGSSNVVIGTTVYVYTCGTLSSQYTFYPHVASPPTPPTPAATTSPATTTPPVATSTATTTPPLLTPPISPSPLPAVSPTPVFTKDLWLGVTDSEVLLLQQYLNTHGFPIASTGSGSSGQETDYFGHLTMNALIKLQSTNGISPAHGYFGPMTMAYINSH